jgi:hypothetical protein
MEQSISIKDALNLIQKTNNAVAPLLEAVVNSLDSIKKRQDSGASFTPAVKIVLGYNTAAKDVFGGTEKILSFITIEDNGEGFTSENSDRFKKLADRSKRLNNRGIGKIQFFHRFKKVNVDSTFADGNIKKNVQLSYAIDDVISEKEVILDNSSDLEVTTSVKLEQFYGNDFEKSVFSSYIDNIKLLEKEIYKGFILRLYLVKETGLKLTIQTCLDGEVQPVNAVIGGDDIPAPDKIETVSIETVQLAAPADSESGSKIEWKVVNNDSQLTVSRFKIPEDFIDNNGIFLFSKTILIEPFRVPFLNNILNKSAVFNGYRYISIVSGDILDEEDNVNYSFDGFNFPNKKDIEKLIKDGDCLFNPKEHYIFIDEIKKKVIEKLSDIYSDICKLPDEKVAEILKIAQTFGIPIKTARAIIPRININSSNNEITNKLFMHQARDLAKLSIEVQQNYNKIVKLEVEGFDPTDVKYEEMVKKASNKLLSLIPKQNRNELARYIIRRDMVVRTLRLAIKNRLGRQQAWAESKAAGEKVREEQESIIHDLFFKRRAKGISSDLWILNEEFVHYSGCSDLPLEKLTVDGCKVLKDHIDIEEAFNQVGLDVNHRLKQRPDIFLFPEEGKCILIEFKAPSVEVESHLYQIERYAKLIANFSEKKIKQFYGFMLGENIDSVNIPGRYRKSTYGKYWFYPSESVTSIENDLPIADLYQEIIPYSTIADRAEIRNRSFADKLGINDTAE